MSTIELAEHIGKTALLNAEPFKFSVRIIDTKLAYGVIRALVEPVSGVGSAWVNLERLSDFK